MNPSKNILKSKTFWINVILVIGVPLWNHYFPTNPLSSGTAITASSVLNIANRFVTDTAVHIV